jgi:hypothetical protein
MCLIPATVRSMCVQLSMQCGRPWSRSSRRPVGPVVVTTLPRRRFGAAASGDTAHAVTRDAPDASRRISCAAPQALSIATRSSASQAHLRATERALRSPTPLLRRRLTADMPTSAQRPPGLSVRVWRQHLRRGSVHPTLPRAGLAWSGSGTPSRSTRWPISRRCPGRS